MLSIVAQEKKSDTNCLKAIIPELKQVVTAYINVCRASHQGYPKRADNKGHVLTDLAANDTITGVLGCLEKHARILDQTKPNEKSLVLSYLILFSIAFQHTVNDLLIDTRAPRNYKNLFIKMQLKSGIEPHGREGIHNLLVTFEGFAMTVSDAYIRKSYFCNDFDYIILLYVCQCVNNKYDMVYLMKEAIKMHNWRAIVCMLLADAIPLPECENADRTQWQLWDKKVIDLNGNEIMASSDRELFCMRTALKEIVNEMVDKDAGGESSLTQADIYECLSTAISSEILDQQLEYIVECLQVTNFKDIQKGAEKSSYGYLKEIASQLKTYLNLALADVFKRANTPALQHRLGQLPPISMSQASLYSTSPPTPSTSSLASSSDTSPRTSPPSSPTLSM
ncbi:MAG: hypothetical protein VYC40_03630 [Pseudomonadota bacterium]|nr:hypothetical protein [Pseudomonadota bacterium]